MDWWWIMSHVAEPTVAYQNWCCVNGWRRMFDIFCWIRWMDLRFHWNRFLAKLTRSTVFAAQMHNRIKVIANDWPFHRIGIITAWLDCNWITNGFERNSKWARIGAWKMTGKVIDGLWPMPDSKAILNFIFATSSIASTWMAIERHHTRTDHSKMLRPSRLADTKQGT